MRKSCRQNGLVTLLLLLFCSLPESSSRAIFKSSKTLDLPLKETNYALKSKSLVIPTPEETTTAKDSNDLSFIKGGAITDCQKIQQVGGLIFFVVFDILLRQLFVEKGIGFPSMMAGCVIIFVFLVLGELISPGSGDAIFEFLTPASSILAKYLASFFVPGLAMLPLSPKIGSSVEVFKFLFMIFFGFFVTVSTTAFSTLLIVGPEEKTEARASKKSADVDVNSVKAVKPYPEDLLKKLGISGAILGLISIVLSKQDTAFALSTPIQTIFMICVSLGTFIFGANLPGGIPKILHPTLFSTLAVWVVIALYASLTSSTFIEVLKTFRVGSLDLMKTGAGDLILFMLGPSVCSLSIAMYSRKKLMVENLLVVVTAMLVSGVGGLFGTAFFVRLLNLQSKAGRLSLLARNVTTALSMAIASILGGDTSIAASVVVMTGTFGATVGKPFLDALNIKNPISRGLAMGAGAQGLGVASMLQEKDSFPFAAISMILTALCSTIVVSIPFLQEKLKDLALQGL